MTNERHPLDPFLNFLIKSGVLRMDQADVIMDACFDNKMFVDYACVDMGFVPQDVILKKRACKSDVAIIDRDNMTVDPSLLDILGAHFCIKSYVAPLSFCDGILIVAMGDVTNVALKDDIQRVFEPITLKTYLASREDIGFALRQARQPITGHVTLSRLLRVETQATGEGNASLFLQELLDQAVAQDCSDIHFDPQEGHVHIQRRLDGVLAPWMDLYKRYWPNLLAKIKIMAHLEPTERRFPQQGHLMVEHDGRTIDCRVATHPTYYGERVVIRILNQPSLTLYHLGFDAQTIDALKELASGKQGLIVVAGPTGSGKTTTLHALLKERADRGDNIMTLEDPVEYRLNFAAQTEVSEVKGFGFEEGIASILRQDVDVLLIGEMRTSQVARMAMRSAMTGHQIFTSVHAPNALLALDRLMDLGVSRHELTTYVRCIISQRLFRCLCPLCKKPALQALCETVGYTPVACERCHDTGYKGRRVLVECLMLDDDFIQAFQKGASNKDLSIMLFRRGYNDFYTVAKDALCHGLTTRQEIQRILGEDVWSQSIRRAS